MSRSLVALLLVATSALAQSEDKPEEGWNLPSQQAPKAFATAAAAAEKRARELSAQGDYAGAADLLERVVAKFGAAVPNGQKYILKNDALLGTTYRKRANWAADGSPRAARALLLDLLDSKVLEIERAEAVDARVLALLKKLREGDPEANAFLARQVQVVVPETGNVAPKVVEIVQQESMADLREAGFNAVAAPVEDVLTVTASQNGIDVGKLAFNVPSAIGDAIPCSVKLRGTWKTGARTMFRSLTASARTKANSHKACLTKAARQASGKITLAVVRAFLHGNWLQKIERVERKLLAR